MAFDRLRRAVSLVLGNRSLLGQVICSCFFRAFVTCSSFLLILCSSLFLFLSWFVCGVLTMHSSRGRLRNVKYYILLVMSELSTVRCDRALGLWVAGTRASSVDEELPWRCCSRWTVRWTAVKGSRDRSSDRAAAVASTPGSRAQAAKEGGFLGLRHNTKEADGG